MIVSYDTLSDPDNFKPPMQTSLLCAARCKAEVETADFEKIAQFCRSAVVPNASSLRVLSRMSWWVDSFSYQMRRPWILWRHEYGVIESRDVIDDVSNQRAVGIFL